LPNAAKGAVRTLSSAPRRCQGRRPSRRVSIVWRRISFARPEDQRADVCDRATGHHDTDRLRLSAPGSPARTTARGRAGAPSGGPHGARNCSPIRRRRVSLQHGSLPPTFSEVQPDKLRRPRNLARQRDAGPRNASLPEKPPLPDNPPSVAVLIDYVPVVGRPPSRLLFEPGEQHRRRGRVFIRRRPPLRGLLASRKQSSVPTHWPKPQAGLTSAPRRIRKNGSANFPGSTPWPLMADGVEIRARRKKMSCCATRKAARLPLDRNQADALLPMTGPQ